MGYTMSSSRKARQGNPVNGIIKIVTVVLLVALVVFFIKTRLDIREMSEQLGKVQEDIEMQTIMNEDAQLQLREDEEFLRKEAREKLDYADPQEKVFIVVP